MKKNLIFASTLILLTPSIAFAAWWNPFSWFPPKVAPQIFATSTVATTSVKIIATTTSKVVQKKIIPVPSVPVAQTPVVKNPIVATPPACPLGYNCTPVANKGVPYKGPDNNWYYPNAYDATGKNLLAACADGYKLSTTTTGTLVCSPIPPPPPSCMQGWTLTSVTSSGWTCLSPSGERIIESNGGCGDDYVGGRLVAAGC